MRFIASVFAALVLASMTLVPQAHAAPDVADGHCTDGKSVTVVVDFQNLGGETIIKCVSGLPDGATGYDAMVGAGITPTGTIADGPEFVCRINGRPAQDENIQIPGGTHNEDCVLTPPDDAFWSYWQAENGGPWTFSQQGFRNRTVIPGGYEGWSFSNNRTADSNPAPRVKPSHSIDKPTPDPKPTKSTPSKQDPTPTKSSPSNDSSDKSGDSRKSKGSDSDDEPASKSSKASETSKPSEKPSASREPSKSPSPQASASESPSPTPSPSASESSAADTRKSSDGTTDVAQEDVGTTDGSVTATQDGSSSGIPVGTIGGLGAVGAAALAGVFVWWRRREG